MPKSKPAAPKKQAKRKTLSPEQLSDLRAFRTKIAKLKKRGLYTGDARKAKPSFKNKKLVKEFSDVLSGDARVFKIKNKDKAKLADEGFKIKNNRVVSPKQYRVRNGKVFLAKKKRTRVIRLDYADLQGSIERAFEDLKPKYGSLALRIAHYSTYDLYDSPQDMMAALEFKYMAGNDQAGLSKYKPVLEVFDPATDFDDYLADVVAQRTERQLAAANARRTPSKKSKGIGRLQALRRSFNSGLF